MVHQVVGHTERSQQYLLARQEEKDRASFLVVRCIVLYFYVDNGLLFLSLGVSVTVVVTINVTFSPD